MSIQARSRPVESLVSSYRFVLVDVFTDKPFSGNQLAVLPQGDGLSDGQMLAIAREFGYSETTFVVPPTRREATFRLRSFTPTAEVFGAGHNALGAWWMLAAQKKLGLAGPLTEVWQELGARVLPLEIHAVDGRPTRIFMTQQPPTWGTIVSDHDRLAEAIGLDADDLAVDSLPAQVVSTGAAHLLVPVKTSAMLKHVHVDPAQLVAIARPLGCEGCYVFTLESDSPKAVARARAFFPGIGIVEDAATGSAAGPLGAYLVAHGRVASGAFTVRQGVEMGRPSLIEVRADGASIAVGGMCVIVGEGELCDPFEA